MELYKEYLHSRWTGDFHVGLNYRDLSGVMVKPHWHDYYEILYILDGEVLQTIDGSRTNLSKGDVIIIHPGKIHATTSLTDNCYIVVVLFMPDTFESVEQLQEQYLQSPYLYEKEIKQAFCRMNEEFTLQCKGYQNIVKGCIHEVLGYLIRNNGNLPLKQSAKSIEIVKICTYIDENICRPINLKEIAKVAGYSPAYFSKFFKKMTGQSFKSYVDSVKMLKAKRLIIFEGRSINDTAAKLGYEDTSTFCRAFKRLNGYAPSSLSAKDAR